MARVDFGGLKGTAGNAGLKLTKAYAYLSDVQDHKQVIPFRRFAGGIGRASQAKQFKTTKGASSLIRGRRDGEG